jgi:hypothetical protein
VKSPSRFLDLLDQFLRRLARMAADLEQCEHQRGELMAHRQTGEAHADIAAGTVDQEAGLALVVIGADHRDLVRKCGDLFQQRLQLARLRIVAQRGDQLDRLANVHEIALELLGQICVEHGETPTNSDTKRPGTKENCRPGPHGHPPGG